MFHQGTCKYIHIPKRGHCLNGTWVFDTGRIINTTGNEFGYYGDITFLI